MKIPKFLNPNNISPNFDYDPKKWEYRRGEAEPTWGNCEFWCNTNHFWLSCPNNSDKEFIYRRPLKKEYWVYVEPKNVKEGDQQLVQFVPPKWETIKSPLKLAIDSKFDQITFRRKVSE